jgi:hypothetical protein
MGSITENTTNDNCLYVLKGKSRDVESIIRLRPWMEDEIRKTHGDFSVTKLFTDYDQRTEIFEFKIVFYR